MCDNWIVVLLSGTSALNKNINSQVYFKKIVWQCHCSDSVITVFKRYWIMSWFPSNVAATLKISYCLFFKSFWRIGAWMRDPWKRDALNLKLHENLINEGIFLSSTNSSLLISYHICDIQNFMTNFKSFQVVNSSPKNKNSSLKKILPTRVVYQHQGSYRLSDSFLIQSSNRVLSLSLFYT